MNNPEKINSLYFLIKRTNSVIKWTGIITELCNQKIKGTKNVLN
jgi:hypothetical protein